MTQIYLRWAWMDLQVLVTPHLVRKVSVICVFSAINYKDVITQVKTVHRSKAVTCTKVHSHLDFFSPIPAFEFLQFSSTKVFDLFTHAL